MGVTPGENCALQSVNECDLFLQTNLGPGGYIYSHSFSTENCE